MVTFYQQKRGKAATVVGRARLRDGRAVWDSSLDLLLRNVVDPDANAPLDPADGQHFLDRLPYLFRSAPYLWAAPEK